jgi:hypothetical protein
MSTRMSFRFERGHAHDIEIVDGERASTCFCGRRAAISNLSLRPAWHRIRHYTVVHMLRIEDASK